MKALNDQLFVELGTTWHGIDRINEALFADRRFDAFRSQAEKILADEFDQGTCPVVKDPRLCRLLPFWQPILAKNSARVVYAIAVRSPVEVAESLAHRNDFEPELGFILWARHYLDAERLTRSSSRRFVSYPDLLNKGVTILDQLRIALDLPISLTTKDRTKVGAFLSEDLRHHRTLNDKSWPQLSRVPGLLEAYEVLIGWAAGRPECDADYRVLDEGRENLDRMSGLLAQILENNRLERKRRASARSQADAALADLNRANLALENLTELREGLDKQGAAIEALTSEIRDRRTIERLRTVIETLSSEVSSRNASERALAASLDQAEALKTEIDALERERDNAKEERQRAIGELRARQDELERAQAELRANQDQLKSVKRKYRSTQEILDGERNRLKDVRSKLAVAETSLARFKTSIPWRLYIHIARFLAAAMRLLHRVRGFSGQERRQHKLQLLHASELFDPAWYLETYPDVAASGLDPAQHYLDFGWREGRDPGPHFSTTAYLKANADVAAHGANPLLHYAEYGHFEGRSAPEHKAPASRATPREEFGPAAPSASFSIAPDTPLAWTTSAQVDAGTESSFEVNGRGVAYLTSAAQQQSLLATTKQLASICGPGGSGAVTPDEGQAELVDAWHLGRGLLRARWRIRDREDPMVVRVLEQSAKDGLTVVGEGLLQSELDTVDAKLSNPLFPLLFIFTAADGTLLGWRTLAFPSLCRGGLHYAEVLALTDNVSAEGDAPIDIGTVSDRLLERLMVLRDGGTPLLSKIELDVRGQDGTHPMFQQEFQSWLATVGRITVRPQTTNANSPAEEHLARSVEVHADASRRSAEAVLHLAGDMIPTISALVATVEPHVESSQQTASLIVLGSEPSQPATLIQIPLEGTNAVPCFHTPAPRVLAKDGSVSTLACSVPATAIRMPALRALTDAELLMPIAPPALSVEASAESIVWLISPAAWPEADLLQALQSLGAQTAIGPSGIAFVSEPQPTVSALADVMFEGRVQLFGNTDEAMANIDGPFVAYLGPGVILHDVRSASLLVSLLGEPETATASAVLVAVEKRGKGWVVSPADAGEMGEQRGSTIVPTSQASKALPLWRSSWPAMRPPRDLWMARAATVRDWDGSREVLGRHLCTSLVTASYCSPRSSSEAPLSPPRAKAEHALRTGIFVG